METRCKGRSQGFCPSAFLSPSATVVLHRTMWWRQYPRASVGYPELETLEELSPSPRVHIPLGTKVWRSLACPLPGRKGDTRKVYQPKADALKLEGVNSGGSGRQAREDPLVTEELRVPGLWDLEVNSSDGVLPHATITLSLSSSTCLSWSQVSLPRQAQGQSGL